MSTNSPSRLMTLGAFVLALVGFGLFQNSAALAQTPETKQTPEVEQLKQRLQQLEQVVSDLKGQINAIEDAKSKSAAPVVSDATYSKPATPEKTFPFGANSSLKEGNLVGRTTSNQLGSFCLN